MCVNHLRPHFLPFLRAILSRAEFLVPPQASSRFLHLSFSLSTENWSPNRVVSGTDSSSQDDLLSLSSSRELLPFEIWYRDNSEDNNSDDPFSWVDPDVKRVSSLYVQGSSLLGTTKKICQPDPWSVVVHLCRPDELVNS
ncbi:hypothetical protein CR513_60961, partial [Mucuna pruriens]